MKQHILFSLLLTSSILAFAGKNNASKTEVKTEKAASTIVIKSTATPANEVAAPLKNDNNTKQNKVKLSNVEAPDAESAFALRY